MSNPNRRRHAPARKQSRGNMSSKATPALVSAEVARLGMYDQEGLYPHLITEVDGTRVVVPLGEPSDASYDAYEVAPFTYQSVPQPEFELGRWFHIKRVRLLALDLDTGDFPMLGTIYVCGGGSLLMYCMGYRGYTGWVPIPGCRTRKRQGNYYKTWEIVVGGAGPKSSRVMVRYDGDSEAFEHWPED